MDRSDYKEWAIYKLRQLTKRLINLHDRNGNGDVFIFSVPRSGSTWLMELICTQPEFRYCAEPFNIRRSGVKRLANIENWEELYGNVGQDKLLKYINYLSREENFFGPGPHRNLYRFYTKRVVFKIIHGLEDNIDRVLRKQDTCLYLLRHPIPVSLSRNLYPRLKVLSTHYKNRQVCDPQEEDVINKVISKGTDLEKGVLSWCIQISLMVKRNTRGNILTYEELVEYPENVLSYIARIASLPDLNAMMDRVNVPSSSAEQSSQETKSYLSSKQSQERSWLISKWKKGISKEQEGRLMDIVKRFNIDIYDAGSLMPKEKYRLG
ncbi:sulfotransferase [Salinibacter ruber]|uniref:sulfotransferase n=1 Tax=Salinibacter ruber TaxID=146919 RepID=UPI00216A1AC0|nr:sulfotransferase [Salinibacter ruber]MCS4223601.1 hypothetical protein [Salinibacter ruber]